MKLIHFFSVLVFRIFLNFQPCLSTSLEDIRNELPFVLVDMLKVAGATVTSYEKRIAEANDRIKVLQSLLPPNAEKLAATTEQSWSDFVDRYATREKRSPQQQQQQPKKKVNVQQLINFVNSQKAQHCLARVICELSVNPRVHGPDGLRFGRNLLSLETQADPVSAKRYRDAANIGQKLENPEDCEDKFPRCIFKSKEVIRIGNTMIGN